MSKRTSRLSVEHKLPLFIGALVLAVTIAIALGAWVQVRRLALTTATDRVNGVASQLSTLFQQSAGQLRAVLATSRASTDYHGPTPDQVVASQLRDNAGAVVRSTGRWHAQLDTVSGLALPTGADSVAIGAFRVAHDSIVYPIVARVSGARTYVVHWRKLGGSRRTREQMSGLVGSDADLFIGSPSTGAWSDLERVVPAPVESGEDLATTRDVAGTPWRVIVHFPAAPVLAPARAFLRRMMVIALVALVLGLSGTWLVSHTILRSLEAEVAERTRELADAQESLVRKERLAILGQLASGVGHELRNPLGVMTNAIYYLKMVLTPMPERVAEYLGILQQQITLSEKIVNDLLDFARLKQPQRKPVSLADVTQAQVARLGATSGVSIDTSGVDAVPPVYADDVQVGQVVLNLLTNAVQAMDGGGRIEVRARSDNGHVRYDVSDTGPGIAPEHLNKVFEPLFTTKARGIGLGLAVSRTLARANEGELTVSSTPGVGATFHLTLPVAPRPVTA